MKSFTWPTRNSVSFKGLSIASFQHSDQDPKFFSTAAKPDTNFGEDRRPMGGASRISARLLLCYLATEKQRSVNCMQIPNHQI